MDSSVKVRQDVVNRLKGMGMTKAISAANSGDESPEFVEAAKRFYGNRVTGQASAEKSKVAGRATPSVGDKTSEPKSVPMPKSAPIAATRKLESSSSTSNEPYREDRYKKFVPSNRKLAKGKSIFDSVTSGAPFKEDRYNKNKKTSKPGEFHEARYSK